jgi:hypothetical protein
MTHSDTETLLLQEVAPRLRAAIPQTIPIVVPDDPEELLQDGLAMAIQIHRGTVKSRKKVSPGNLAHYALLHLRSGRRSTGIKKNDVLHPAAQLNGHAKVRSMDEPVSDGEDGDEPLTLHDCLAASADDPVTAAARRLDWTSVIQSLDRTAKAILIALIEGRELTLLVSRLKRSRTALQYDKAKLGRLIQDHLGPDILVQAQARMGQHHRSGPATTCLSRRAAGWLRKQGKGPWGPFPSLSDSGLLRQN